MLNERDRGVEWQPMGWLAIWFEDGGGAALTPAGAVSCGTPYGKVCIKLGYGNLTPEEIEEGVRRMKAVLRA